MNEYALYEIGSNPSVATVRYSIYAGKGLTLTDEELEAKEIVSNGFGSPKYRGKAGVTIDPYIAAEAILADHYGSARMLEAHYTWKPRIRY